jgi:hypothetical protein
MTIDITSTKVIVPALLFAALSPGLIVRIRSGPHAAILSALMLGVAYFLIAKFVFKVTLTKADLIVPVVLAVLLTPGLLVTLPPGSGGVFRSGQTSTVAIGAHTLVYAVAFSLLRSSFPQYY